MTQRLARCDSESKDTVNTACPASRVPGSESSARPGERLSQLEVTVIGQHTHTRASAHTHTQLASSCLARTQATPSRTWPQAAGEGSQPRTQPLKELNQNPTEQTNHGPTVTRHLAQTPHPQLERPRVGEHLHTRGAAHWHPHTVTGSGRWEWLPPNLVTFRQRAHIRARGLTHGASNRPPDSAEPDSESERAAPAPRAAVTIGGVVDSDPGWAGADILVVKLTVTVPMMVVKAAVRGASDLSLGAGQTRRV